MLLRATDYIEDDEKYESRAPEPSGDARLAEDGIEVEEEGPGLLASLPGPLIGAATFVPTFLAVFFGLSYALSSVPALLAGVPAAQNSPPVSIAAPPSSEPATPRAEAPRDPFAPPPGLLEPPASSRGDARREAPAADSGNSREIDRPAEASREATGREVTPPTTVEPGAAPGLPPASPPSARERRAPAAAPEPPRRARAATPAPEAPASTESRGKNWTPAAAFTDREAANRLAGSIREQGYPVEIRQDRSSTRPWVVWIGARPRGGDRSR